MKIRATYEDGVLKPQTPLPLPEHAEVEVEVEAETRVTVSPVGKSSKGAIKTVPRLVLERLIGSVAIGGDAVADKKAYYDDP